MIDGKLYHRALKLRRGSPLLADGMEISKRKDCEFRTKYPVLPSPRWNGDLKKKGLRSEGLNLAKKEIFFKHFFVCSFTCSHS
jgi:hypothetical protein